MLSFVALGTGTAWDWQLKKLERRVGRSGFFKTLKDGGRAVLFSEALTSIRTRSPWYYFSGGLLLQIREQTYKMSFGRPARSSASDNELRTVSTMREVGKQWLRALRSE